nr:hypothetical protein [Bordetella genomosp. 9]
MRVSRRSIEKEVGQCTGAIWQLYWEHRTAGVPEPLDNQQTGCRRSPAKAHGLRDIDALELGGNGRWSAIGDGLPLGLCAIKFWSRPKFKGANALKKKINPTGFPSKKRKASGWRIFDSRQTCCAARALRARWRSIEAHYHYFHLHSKRTGVNERRCCGVFSMIVFV